jgi:O-antigen/teichoic acid export membrane protein
MALDTSDSNPRKGSVLQNTMIGIGGEVLTIPLAVFSSVIINRWLGPGDRGTWALVLATNTLLSAALAFGIPLALAVLGAKQTSLLKHIHAIALFVSVTAGVLGLLAYPVLKPVLNAMSLSGLDAKYVIVAIILIPLSVYGTFWDSLVTSLESIVVLNGFKIIYASLLLITPVLALVILNLRLDGMLILWILSMIFFNGIRAYWLKKRSVVPLAWNNEVFRQSVRLGSGIYISYMLAIATNQAEVFILNFFQSSVQVGLYAAASGLAFRVGLVAGALISATNSRITTSSPTASAQITALLVRRFLFFSVVSWVCITIGAHLLITTLYGMEYEPAVMPFVLLVWASIARSITQFCALYVVNQRERPHLTSLINVTVLVLTVVLLALLSASYGVIGAAVAVMGVSTYQAVVYLGLFKYLSHTPLRDFMMWNGSDWRWMRSLGSQFYMRLAARFQ